MKAVQTLADMARQEQLSSLLLANSHAASRRTRRCLPTAPTGDPQSKKDFHEGSKDAHFEKTAQTSAVTAGSENLFPPAGSHPMAARPRQPALHTKSQSQSESKGDQTPSAQPCAGGCGSLASETSPLTCSLHSTQLVHSERTAEGFHDCAATTTFKTRTLPHRKDTTKPHTQAAPHLPRLGWILTFCTSHKEETLQRYTTYSVAHPGYCLSSAQ